MDPKYTYFFEGSDVYMKSGKYISIGYIKPGQKIVGYGLNNKEFEIDGQKIQRIIINDPEDKDFPLCVKKNTFVENYNDIMIPISGVSRLC